MKNLVKLSVIALVMISAMTSCTSVKQIGKVNMISNRNVDPNLKYQSLTTYSGGSKRELKKSKATSIEAAIDNTVKKVPGGEFLMNCKIYVVNSKYIAVEGDVWGSATTELQFRGFKVGDKVTWKKKDLISGTKFYTGSISALKDDKTCYIKVDGETDKVVELSYDDITKTE